jgi:CotH kinase protein/Secretion system C-terminal sorting domain
MKKQSFLLILATFWLKIAFAQVTLTESKLPIFIITTTNAQAIPDEPKITADLRVIWNGEGKLNKLTDTASHYKNKIGIEMRGSTSQSISDKKPYSIELRDATGKELEIPLLGLPKHEDWALIAPYSDKTLMRDALMYKWGSEMMAWAAKTRFCEVIVNGAYRGVYVLTERIKRGKDRVNIAKMDSSMISGDNLTGGYIVKIDKSTGNPSGFSTGWNSTIPTSTGKFITFQYDYPKPEDIQSAQRGYIRSAVAEMETAMNSARFADSTVGYAKYWDVNSLVDFFILNEVARNVDGYRLSTYFHKDRNSVNSKFKMGPIWDFNIALGNADYCAGGSPYGWAYQFNLVCPNDGWGVPFWWDKLLSDPNFKKKVGNRWKQLRQKELAFTRVNTLIDSMYNNLGDAATRNFQQWNILNRYVWPNARVNGSYWGEITYLRSWLTDRINWLDGQFSTFTSTVIIDRDPGSVVVYPNPSDGIFTFGFFVANKANVNLLIYNDLGQTVLNKTYLLDVGEQQIKWQNKSVGNGVYYYRLIFDGQERMKGKLVKI